MTRRARSAIQDIPLEEQPIVEVWVEYQKTGSEKIRNFLMRKYLHLVRYVAEKMHERLPGEVDIDDLKQAGVFGLVGAINSFDLDRGVKFETYCTPRIRGAMLDELRAMDPVPRLVRARTARVDGVRRKLEMGSGRPPTRQEVAKALGMRFGDFEKIEKDTVPVTRTSLDRKCFETDSNKDVREVDVLEDRRQPDPMRKVQRRDLRELVTKGLSRAEQMIIVLYYYEELTMKEIGRVLDLSESRVSQMHSSVLARLRAQMQGRDHEFEAEPQN